MITAISFIIVFCLLVFFHEFGHFAAAKLNGIYVHKFALGMGPIIFKKKVGETEYSLRLLPIGGFVSMEGEDEDSDHPRAFTNKTPLQRLSVLISGPFMNFVLAIILFLALFLTIGFPSNIVGEVSKDLPAYNAGIKSGDIIKSINDVSINSWSDVVNTIIASDTVLKLKIDRNGDIQDIVVKPVEKDGRKVIGITSYYEKSVIKSLKYSFLETFNVTKGIISFLVNLPFRGMNGGDIVGPVGMVNMIGTAAKSGFINLLALSAMISINLGIFNLLPLPALDGGRVIFILIELLRGKPLNKEIEGKIHFIGFALLMSLMIFLVFRDISRL